MDEKTHRIPPRVPMFSKSICWKTICLGRNPFLTLVRTLVLGSVLFVLARYFYTPTTLNGVSMEPTFRDRSFNLIDRTAFLKVGPERGKVVVISPRVSAGREYYLKRVLALPGDTLEFREGDLFVNGEWEAEAYLSEKGNWDMPLVRVPVGRYWVSGDNRSLSINEQWHGLIERERIIGSLLLQPEGRPPIKRTHEE